MLFLLTFLLAFAWCEVKSFDWDEHEEFTKDYEGVLALKLYAPWCGHCKRLAPTWDEVGASFEGQEGITIGKLDASKHNEAAKFYKLQGYPTIIMRVPGRENWITYQGGRKKEDFLAWIEKEAGYAPTPEAPAEEVLEAPEAVEKD